MSIADLAIRSLLVSLFVLGAVALPRLLPRRDLLLVVGAALLVLLVPISFLPKLELTAPTLGGQVLAESAGSWFSSTWVVVLWMTGSLIVAMRWFMSAILLRLRLRQCQSCEDPAVLDAATAVADELRLSQAVAVKVHPHLASPAVAGLLRPSLLLPADALSWEPQQLRAVLLHEFAHLRRLDLWRELAFRLAEVLYWWNPSVWLLARLHREEREQRCDAEVMRTGFSPVLYARALLRLATRDSALGSVAMAAGGRLERRISALFEMAPPRPQAGVVVPLLLILGMALLALSFLGIQAKPPVSVDEVHLRLTADPFPG